MRHVRLGGTGLRVSQLCLGTMTFGLQCDEATSVAILDRAAAGLRGAPHALKDLLGEFEGGRPPRSNSIGVVPSISKGVGHGSSSHP